MARALGIGGVFFKANDPQKLMSWYENVLGVVAQRYGNTGSSGVPFNLLALPAEAYVQWSAAPRDSKHYDGDFMFNFVVDDVDEVLKQVRAHGGTMVREPFDLENVGRFGWFRDPEGNQMEIWKPVPPTGRTRERLDAQVLDHHR